MIRPKIKFLTVVWGNAYIERFATLALPSLLAPGNLPALAAAGELEVVIMTSQGDFAAFERQPAFRRLREVCTLRFVEIDDLIVGGLYGITLTLAYARAVIACGEAMLGTHFVFMNSDFVLADGSLRALARQILAGRAIVLAPSFRATAEELEPRLRSAVDPESRQLVVAPRELTEIALKHPHPTTVAKIVNQDAFHSTHPNQFFWRIDEQTLLGRYFLIFMLCLKPERLIASVDTFCDYGFIPEMCPSGDETIMGDSDEFFMLELQERDQEMHLLRRGRASDDAIVRSLAEWTTAEHRRAAHHDVVFHGGDLPSGLERAKVEAGAYIERIQGRLGRPVGHRFHPYWLSGMKAYSKLYAERGHTKLPYETVSHPIGLVAKPWLGFLRAEIVYWARALPLAIRYWLIGKPPDVTPFHPDWIDYVHLRRAVDAMARTPGARILVVRNGHVAWTLRGIPASYAMPSEVLGDRWQAQGGASPFTHTLIYMRHVDSSLARRLVEKCRSAMRAGGGCFLFIHRARDELDPADPAVTLTVYTSGDSWALLSNAAIPTPTRFLQSVRQWATEAKPESYTGGTLKHANRRLLTRLRLQFERFGLLSVLWLSPMLAVLLPMICVCNLWLRLRQPSPTGVQNCSSMLIRVDK